MIIYCEGFLRLKKKRTSFIAWTTRYVVLRGNELMIFYSKIDASHRRNILEKHIIQHGQIDGRKDLHLEFMTTQKIEFQGRVYNRADLAKWITAFHRLALLEEEQNNQMTFSTAIQQANNNKYSITLNTGNNKEQEVQAPECIEEENQTILMIQTTTSPRKKVTFHESVHVRLIPSLPKDQVTELFYSKEDMKKFTAQAGSLLCRTEDAVSSAYLSIRRGPGGFRKQYI
jgi:hypothetical protein